MSMLTATGKNYVALGFLSNREPSGSRTTRMGLFVDTPETFFCH
jgi:hypothetical protein